MKAIDRLRSSMIFIATLWAALMALGQDHVATVVNLNGILEVRRSGEAWEPVLAGAAIMLGDELRTGPGASARILFQDDSVVDLASKSHLSVERLVIDARTDRRAALLNLRAGQLRSAVSSVYEPARSRYEVETGSAIIVAHGGEFIITFDPERGDTAVIVIEGSVEVEATLGVIGPKVTVRRQEICRVLKGRYPLSPQRLTEAQLAEYRAGFPAFGSAPTEGIIAGHPALSGRVLRPEDLPLPAAAAQDSRKHLTPPADPLPERLSPDVRAHAQPIPEYRLSRPGVPID